MYSSKIEVITSWPIPFMTSEAFRDLLHSTNASSNALAPLLLLLYQKGCKPKCRFSQVIILGKYEVNPQGMIRHKKIILIIMQKRKNRNLIFPLESEAKE